MIKFIACDLDGTLLDPSGNLPQGIFDTIEKLYKKGITFCPASGRQVVALQKMFAPVADKILILAENGAIVRKNGETLYCDALPEARILAALKGVRGLKNAHALLCSPECAYYEEEIQPFVKFVKASYLQNQKAELANIAHAQTICKIAVYDECGPENDGMKVLPELLPDLRVIQSGGNWLDISLPSSNKGRAVRFIQQKFGFAANECAAFGDHMNDLEMLLACGHAYAPENAYEGLKSRISGRTASNAEGGVLTAMNEILEGRIP